MLARGRVIKVQKYRKFLILIKIIYNNIKKGDINKQNRNE